MGISKTCGCIRPYLLWFSHSNAPQFCGPLYIIYNMCTLNHGKFHSITVIKRKASTIQNFVCGLMVTKRNAVQTPTLRSTNSHINILFETPEKLKKCIFVLVIYNCTGKVDISVNFCSIFTVFQRVIFN